jgi:RND family efflux transporter MFP subunit
MQSDQVEDSSTFVGNLEAKQKAALSPQISGRIEEILVTQGATVSQGTPIVQLRPDKQTAQVEGSVAEVSSASATLQTAQAQARSNAAVVAQREAEVQAQEAAVQQRTADLQLARTNYERSRELLAEGAVAQQDLDNKTNALRSAEAARNAAVQQLEASRRAYNSAIAEAQGSQSSVDGAAARLRTAEANVKSATVDLSYNQVVAPITGTVGDLSTLKVGDFVNPGQSITTITQNDELDLRINVPTNRTDQLRIGLPVQLIDPNTKQPLATGSINFVSPQVDRSAQAILVKARFPNQNGKLRDGQYVQARVIWSRGVGITVPTSAITRIGGQGFVFLAKDAPCDPQKAEADTKQPASPPPQGLVACQQPVQLGDIQGSNYKVLSGVKPGDRLVVSNILKLRHGAAIQPDA